MNVFNVHVNRAPVAGNIKDIIYVPGKFINASLDKASEHNERNILVLENNKNEEENKEETKKEDLKKNEKKRERKVTLRKTDKLYKKKLKEL